MPAEGIAASIEDRRASLAAALGPRALSDLEAGTIVVLPSLSFPPDELRKIVGIQYYEERLLFMALLLDRPSLRIVYVTSTPIDPVVVDYYLSFLSDPDEARKRLHLVTIDDATPVSLSEKLIERPDAIERLRDLVDQNTYALTFNVTPLEWQVMDMLGVLVYGTHPDLTWLGSKSGSRKVARDAGVAVLPGAEDLMSLDEVEASLRTLATDPEVSAVIKLNNGFSGQGNAIIRLDDLRSPLTANETLFCAVEESWPSFGRKIRSEGAIVERLMREPGTVSPSVQMRVAADGTFEVVSTHDQILGGPDDQVYLGCRFPADDAYRLDIQEAGRNVATVLADRGVVGSFGIDLLVAPNGKIYLSEINLRMGGTSHPFYMARFATHGHYDETTGHLIADGRSKFYVASDNLKSPSLVGLKPENVIDALQNEGLAYDSANRTGVTLHLLGALMPCGKLGCVAIADSRAEAQRLYSAVGRLLERLGGS